MGSRSAEPALQSPKRELTRFRRRAAVGTGRANGGAASRRRRRLGERQEPRGAGRGAAIRGLAAPPGAAGAEAPQPAAPSEGAQRGCPPAPRRKEKQPTSAEPHAHGCNGKRVTAGKAPSRAWATWTKPHEEIDTYNTTVPWERSIQRIIPERENIQGGKARIILPPVHKTPGPVFLTGFGSYKERSPLPPS